MMNLFSGIFGGVNTGRQSPTGEPTNRTAAANGGTVAASSIYDSRFQPSNTNDGRRTYTRWDDPGQIWIAGTNSGSEFLYSTFPVCHIEQINLFTVTDDFTDNAEPDANKTFNSYGVTGYDLRYLDSSDNWQPVETISQNFYQRKTHTVSLTAKGIGFFNLQSPDGYIRIAEIEAFG